MNGKVLLVIHRKLHTPKLNSNVSSRSRVFFANFLTAPF